MAIIPLVNRRLRRGKPSHPHFRKPSARHRVEGMPVTGLVQVLPAFRKPTARMSLPAARAEALILGISPSEKTIKVKATDFRKRRLGYAPIDKN